MSTDLTFITNEQREKTGCYEDNIFIQYMHS